MRAGGRRLATILKILSECTVPGVTTAELDKLAYDLIIKDGDESAFLNYRPGGAAKPFPATLCVSVNDEVVHGLPGSRVVVAGDVVSLDLGLKHGGLYVDSAVTVAVPPIKQETSRLLDTTRRSLAAGIAALAPGKYLSDASHAIEQVINAEGFGLVRVLGGHGVGHKLHEEPEIPNFGEPGYGPRLEVGWVLAIEPMVTLGRGSVRTGPDGFTIVTRDGSLAAHFEPTIAITKTGAEILTTL